jgi:hypothetical protein
MKYLDKKMKKRNDSKDKKEKKKNQSIIIPFDQGSLGCYRLGLGLGSLRTYSPFLLHHLAYDVRLYVLCPMNSFLRFFHSFLEHEARRLSSVSKELGSYELGPSSLKHCIIVPYVTVLLEFAARHCMYGKELK